MLPLWQLTSNPTFKPYALPYVRAFSLGLPRKGPARRQIAIRYQIELAAALVTEAIRVRQVRADAPLLIYGSGATAAAAAAVALEAGIPVTLRARSDRPFGLQRGTSRRWLHPNQYDWGSYPPASPLQSPEPWEASSFSGPPEALSWSAGYSDAIANLWETAWNERIKTRSGLTLNQPHVGGRLARIKGAGKHAKTGPRFHAAFESFLKSEDERANRSRGAASFGLVIFTGFPPEQCNVPHYRGIPFWRTDPFDSLNCGQGDTRPCVLISGGGDGAQQDLLRIAFKASPLTLLRDVRDALGVSEWEHVSQLAYAFHSAHAAADPNVPTTLNPYASIVSGLSRAGWGRIQTALRARLREDFDPTLVSFAFRGPHLPICLPLNCFLTLLLQRLATESLEAPELFRPNTTLKRLARPGERNGGDGTAQPRFSALLERAGVEEWKKFDLVIVRHGMCKKAGLFRKAAS